LDLGIECKIFTCGNDDYEVLKLRTFNDLHEIPKLPKPYSVFKYFPGPGKMDNIFQGLSRNCGQPVRSQPSKLTCTIHCFYEPVFVVTACSGTASIKS